MKELAVHTVEGARLGTEVVGVEDEGDTVSGAYVNLGNRIWPMNKGGNIYISIYKMINASQ